MNGKKVILNSIIVILLAIILVSITNKTYSVESENVIYVEDLKVGDFVPYGTILKIGENYHCYSSVNGYLCNGVYFLFFDTTLENKYSYQSPYTQGEYSIGSYSDYFGEDAEVVGWVYNGFLQQYGHSYYSVSFIPVSSYSSISEEPVNNNDYAMCVECASNEEPTYSWYYIKNVNQYSIYSYDNVLIENVDNNNLFFREGLVRSTNTDDLIVSYNIDASKGDVLEFETRGGYNYYRDVYGDVTVFELINFGDYIYESSLYVDNSIELDEDLDVLSFKLIGNYGYIRNLKVLTYINEGNQLDLAKVSDGDIVYSYATCGDGYQIVSNPVIVDVASKNEDDVDDSSNNNDDENTTDDTTTNDNEDVTDDKTEKNPNTIDFVVIVIMLFIGSFIIFLIVKNKYKWQKDY